MSEQMLIEFLKENLALELEESGDVVLITLQLKGETISSVAFCVGEV